MFCISKPRADRGKLVPFLESAGQIYPETGLTYEAPKCVLASVIHFADNSGLKFSSIFPQETAFHTAMPNFSQLEIIIQQ
jgi:hypothetical protein